jgi:hypothetical protein
MTDNAGTYRKSSATENDVGGMLFASEEHSIVVA